MFQKLLTFQCQPEDASPELIYQTGIQK